MDKYVVTVLAKEALASSVALEEMRHRLSIDALADVDAGRTLEQAEVAAWASRLSISERSKRRG